jgi:hypothetical protein
VTAGEGSDGATAADSLRPLLFGDVPLEGWPADDGATGEPWSSFVAARAALADDRLDEAIRLWAGIAATPGVESRHVVQAWTFLRANGVHPEESIAAVVHGVVIEVPVDAGRDVLAAYRDGSARYLNHSGAALVVDAGPASVTTAVAAVIAAAQPVADVGGVWEDAGLPDLPPLHSRLLMLTPGGPRFGQGPEAELRKEPMAAHVLDVATHLLVTLVALQTG